MISASVNIGTKYFTKTEKETSRMASITLKIASWLLLPYVADGEKQKKIEGTTG